jgi:hypothetical protein
MRQTLDSGTLERAEPTSGQRRAEFVRPPRPWEPEAECTCFDGICLRDHENE